MECWVPGSSADLDHIDRATIRNVTYEEDNAAFTYTGIWGNNTSPIFSGGGTTYTNADRATASLKFNGGSRLRMISVVISFERRLGGIPPGRY